MASPSGAGPETTRKARSPESFDSIGRRNGAAEILQSYERLSWFANQRCETITQTRTHFQGLVAGFTAEDEEKRIHWKEDFTPHPGYEGRSSRKGKERASLGGGGAAAETSAKGASNSRNREKGREKGRSSTGEGSKSPRANPKEGENKRTTVDARDNSSEVRTRRET